MPNKAESSVHALSRATMVKSRRPDTVRSRRPELPDQVGVQVVKGLRVVIVFIDGFNFLLF